MARASSGDGFLCSGCGATAAKWLGRCASCGAWGTLEAVAPVPAARVAAPVAITSITAGPPLRFGSGMAGLDHVLGGGWVRGACVLLGGDPGIGKSTLLLQAAVHAARAARRVIYATGEETAEQVGLRAVRLNAVDPRLHVLAATDAEVIASVIERERPELVIVDSVQMVQLASAAGVPGSVSQVRACACRFIAAAKASGAALVLVGHVTKDGQLAGPKLLEHAVDVVLSFEGERSTSHRVLRGTKNRFGSTDEIVVLEMAAAGLRVVDDPSAVLGSNTTEPGAAVAVVVEGSRPYLIEVQALVGPRTERSAHIRVTGLEFGRVALVAAVLDRNAPLDLMRRDIFVKTAGNLCVADPGVDLAWLVALGSAAWSKAVPERMSFAGEVGLTGEIRRVPRCIVRAREALRLGLRVLVMPAATPVDDVPAAGAEPVRHVRDVLALIAPRRQELFSNAPRSS
ncbi:MAG: DNA repair protein RadA [Planctomycetota bacterium]